ncbi:MAG TPA: DNA repair protein RadC [Anaerolineae bacterium]
MSEVVEYRSTIKDMPSGDRPRERLAFAGAGALSNAELLAIILRVGTGGENALSLAQRLINRHGLVGLHRKSIAELSEEKGLGEAKIAQIKAAFELGRRLLASAPDERAQIRTPIDAANILMSEMALLEQEQMRVVLLDTRNRIICVPTMYVGSLNTTLVRVSEIFREAIRQNAAAIIVAHNHPSGDPTPSPEDVAVTQEIINAGRLLDIEVLDHLIIGRQRFVSLKERGLAFE